MHPLKNDIFVSLKIIRIFDNNKAHKADKKSVLLLVCFPLLLIRGLFD